MAELCTYSAALVKHCNKQGWDKIWYVADPFFMVVGGLANGVLLCLFLMERKSLSASKVLGLNLAAMDLIFLFTVLGGNIYAQGNLVKGNQTACGQSQVLGPTDVSILNMLGCPLLLTCMCVERYLAVMRPVLYRRLRQLAYRVAVSAAVWFITLVFVVASVLAHDEAIIMAPVSIIISFLFVVMLGCLGSVIRSLRQPSPALAAHGSQRCPESSLKRQAAHNVLIVVVPAVMSYLPVLLLCPLLLFVYYKPHSYPMDMCNAVELFFLFPRLGVFIGPLFYFSKARKVCGLRGTRDKHNERET